MKADQDLHPVFEFKLGRKDESGRGLHQFAGLEYFSILTLIIVSFSGHTKVFDACFN